MRGTPAALASLIAHGVVVVLAARWGIVRVTRPAAAAAAAATPPAEPAGAEPIAVSFLGDASAGGASPAGGVRGRGSPGPRGDARIATSRGGEAPEAGKPVRGEPSAGGKWLKMRGPELAVSEGFVEGLVARSRPLETVRKSGRVEDAGGGAHAIHDRVTNITIDRDGTAHFHDKPDVDFHWDIHLPTFEELARQGRQAGREIAEWYQDPYKQARVGRSQDVARHLSAAPGACDSWTDACSIELRGRDKPEDQDHGGGILHGKLDITAMLMRKFVGDPHASRKLALLDGTRDERADIGARNTKDDLARSVQFMQRNLERLWRTTSDPAARRQALFALWDECGEGDGAVGEAGERARRLVIGWIRGKLPPGSPGAFTADDIARFAAQRTSRQPFVPYE